MGDEPSGPEIRFTIGRDLLASVVKLLGTCVEEVAIGFTKDGFEARAVDPAHVSMIDLSVGRPAFSAYEFTGDATVRVAIDLDKLAEFLRVVREDAISVVIRDPSVIAKAGRTTRNMRTVDRESLTDPKIPNLNTLPAAAPYDPVSAGNALRQATYITDHVALKSGGGSWAIVGEGDTDTVETVFEVPAADGEGLDKEVRSLFPLDYLTAFNGSLPEGVSARIRFGQDYPMRVEFSFGTNGAVRGLWLLAPRIESEE